ncbi:YciI family protein [Paeniglutamicibacter sp. MACA_103]|uniref:YciI family protein n=1 Tax=Paeniglutamicibacter sp. MACA_103 TaxID=3377337 RepID=UPI003895D2C2
MTKFLISFPGEAMVFPEEDFESVAKAAHAVIDDAKAAGVYVFAGGINEDIDPVLVAGDGTITEGTYPGHKVPNGGYTVLELPSREAAFEWAAKIAVACRCPQEVRQFQYDPAS